MGRGNPLWFRGCLPYIEREGDRMKLHHILVLSVFLPILAQAEDAVAPAPEPAEVEAVYAPIPASEVTLEQFLWVKRPLVVFADTPNDPNFQRQMQRINAELGPLQERGVVVITDSDPAANTSVRHRLRPRGFSLVLMDMDGEVKRRVPSPWHVREIAHAIDRFPLRRDEMRAPRR
jgi:hypothetical protein